MTRRRSVLVLVALAVAVAAVVVFTSPSTKAQKASADPTTTEETTTSTVPDDPDIDDATTDPAGPTDQDEPTDEAVDDEILRALATAQDRGLKSGPETAGGVDCVDGCVIFGGLEGATAEEKVEDLKAKLVLSPSNADFMARYVRYVQSRDYEVTGSVGDNAKHLKDLQIVFDHIMGADEIALRTMPAGTTIFNSVRQGDQIVQFEQTLKKDREYLLIREDDDEVIVFTTCGNMVTPVLVPDTPKVPEQPQREFPDIPTTTTTPTTEAGKDDQVSSHDEDSDIPDQIRGCTGTGSTASGTPSDGSDCPSNTGGTADPQCTNTDGTHTPEADGYCDNNRPPPPSTTSSSTTTSTSSTSTTTSTTAPPSDRTGPNETTPTTVNQPRQDATTTTQPGQTSPSTTSPPTTQPPPPQ